MKTWIEKNRIWIKGFASSHPILNVIFFMPLIVWLFSLGRNWIYENPALASLSFALGAIYWTFLEYAIHRWVYHGRYKNEKVRSVIESFHIYHHRNINDTEVLTAGPLMYLPLAIFFLAPVWVICMGNKGAFSCVGAGLILMYLFYEWVHYSIHQRKPVNKYFLWITDYHMFHHKNWTVNFGNTVDVWDRLFNTYAPVNANEKKITHAKECS